MTYEVEDNKIKSFTDLHTWQEGHKLVIAIYQATKSFPVEENYGLRSQMQRAAVSITSNIAEGFSRRSLTDQRHFYTIAKGSLTEIQNQLLIARDVGYIEVNLFENIAKQSISVQNLLIGLIRSSHKLERSQRE